MAIKRRRMGKAQRAHQPFSPSFRRKPESRSKTRLPRNTQNTRTSHVGRVRPQAVTRQTIVGLRFANPTYIYPQVGWAVMSNIASGCHNTLAITALSEYKKQNTSREASEMPPAKSKKPAPYFPNLLPTCLPHASPKNSTSYDCDGILFVNIDVLQHVNSDVEL